MVRFSFYNQKNSRNFLNSKTFKIIYCHLDSDRHKMYELTPQNKKMQIPFRNRLSSLSLANIFYTFSFKSKSIKLMRFFPLPLLDSKVFLVFWFGSEAGAAAGKVSAASMHAGGDETFNLSKMRENENLSAHVGSLVESFSSQISQLDLNPPKNFCGELLD